MGCRHNTFLEFFPPKTGTEKAGFDEQTKLVQKKGLEHERNYLNFLRDSGLTIVEIPTSGNLEERVSLTSEAMSKGVDIIYQAVFLNSQWHGFSDFLERVESPSKFGPYSYEPLDTKLSKTSSPKHILQLCVYSELLEHVQGRSPHQMHLVLGDGRKIEFAYEDFAYYYHTAKGQFETFAKAPPKNSQAEPCQHCSLCQWQKICEQEWCEEDHLSQVANIQQSQIKKLEAASVTTVRLLAELEDTIKIPKLSAETIIRLKSQAQLQIKKRDTGENQLEILPVIEGKGFARMPEPNLGDLFFDMEGDPLYPDGLEYLFGFYYFNGKKPIFTPFWAHNHEAEQSAFEEVIDFLIDYLDHYSHTYIYHYNHYEETALKRLASRYGTKEAEVDNLLRQRKLVDLYKVVREAIRVSEPKYSIKNLETFYMKKRSGDVATAVDSIVVYEQWRNTQDAKLLRQISDYNEDDCRSTYLLREWLLTQRPPETPWLKHLEEQSEEKLQVQQEAEEKRIQYERNLLSGISDDEHPYREPISQLLEFHSREAKPQWWAMFDRQSKTDDELMDDNECVGGLKADMSRPPYQEKRSTVFCYRFPEQNFKFKVGDSCLLSDTLESAGSIVYINESKGIIKLKRSSGKGALPNRLSIIPKGPISCDVLKTAIYRFADSVIDGDNNRFLAVEALLRRRLPVITGQAKGSPLISENANPLEASIKAVVNLKNSYLFIQGPPGAGKTYTSSHIIVDLLKAGKRVGVSSNSHKAINNLLLAIEKVAKERGVNFRGQKKCSAGQDETHFNGELIENITSTKINPQANLVAGTAWLFAREELDETLDYLFIDEAGQVSLANIVAMGTSTKNIILIGDQMQLGQPIQGVHPGESGMSVLEYLLQGEATIPPDRGIFLGTTWRMHENVCKFISDAVYDGRLHPENHNQNQSLLLSKHSHPALKKSGIQFLAATHTGCSQKSEIEGEIIHELYENLLKQNYQDRYGKHHKMTLDNILVVTPYNVQVNYLKSILPAMAKVGTVDKFQGQEAEVVLISMVTSSSEDLPRDIEFLYSKNRLNVAISRAKILSVVVANPNLLEIPCQTIEQMKLVNTLCWVKEYAM